MSNSIMGRPRKATDEQVAAILKWHASRKTLAQFSAEINLPVSLVQYVISRRGQYKQISPERRAEASRSRSRRYASMRMGGWL